MKNKIYTKILFTVYILLLLWIIVFKMSFSIAELDKARSINLIPFYYPNETQFHLSEIIKNLLIFIPFGVYLKIINTRTKRIVLLGFIYSFLMETFQFFLAIGRSDITDLITNTSGAILGIIIYAVLSKICKRSDKLNMTLNILATIGTVIMISLLTLVTFFN